MLPRVKSPPAAKSSRGRTTDSSGCRRSPLLMVSLSLAAITAPPSSPRQAFLRAMSDDFRHELRSDPQRSYLPGWLFRGNPSRHSGRADLRHQGPSLHRNAPQCGHHLRLGCHPPRHAGSPDQAFSCSLRRVGQCGPLRRAGCRSQHDCGDVLGPVGRPTQFSRTLRVVPAQSERIDVPIDPRDHFLTLATTTPGEYRYCWALFAEPALELTKERLP